MRRRRLLRASNPLATETFIDLLGDQVSVRYFLRLVVMDSQGEDRWNTTEVVLYRSKPPAFDLSQSASTSGGISTAVVNLNQRNRGDPSHSLLTGSVLVDDEV